MIEQCLSESKQYNVVMLWGLVEENHGVYIGRGCLHARLASAVMFQPITSSKTEMELKIAFFSKAIELLLSVAIKEGS